MRLARKGIRSIRGFLVLMVLAAGLASAVGTELVYRVVISGTIDLALAPYVARVIKDAERDNADLIVFDINTLGGRMDAMLDIRDAIVGAKVPTVAYVNPRAISAGALIALACRQIYMAPGATIGAATPVWGGGQKASEKVVSYARSEFRATAERNGRDPEIAAAMVDESIRIPGVIEEGKLLTLTTEKALRRKFVDGQSSSFDSLLRELKFEGAQVFQPKITWAERLVRLLNNPIVSAILLSMGFFWSHSRGSDGWLGSSGLSGNCGAGTVFWLQVSGGAGGLRGITPPRTGSDTTWTGDICHPWFWHRRCVGDRGADGGLRHEPAGAGAHAQRRFQCRFGSPRSAGTEYFRHRDSFQIRGAYPHMATHWSADQGYEGGRLRRFGSSQRPGRKGWSCSDGPSSQRHRND